MPNLRSTCEPDDSTTLTKINKIKSIRISWTSL